MPETIRVRYDDAVAEIALDRPDKLNSFTAEMLDRLGEALEAAAAAPEIRAVLLTGTGRAFCAGQDLADPALAREAPAETLFRDHLERVCNPLIRRLRALPLPVVCAVNGVAAGAGTSIALACDIVIAARSARFVPAFDRVGLVPDMGASWALARRIGPARARGFAMLGEPLDAETAAAWGLIWKAVDDAALAGEAHALAERLARQPTAALALAKQAFDVAEEGTLETQLALEARLQGRAAASEDHREGLAAFREKREPAFRGR